jgi:hypothetical protein
MSSNVGNESNYSSVTSEGKSRKVSILADPLKDKEKDGYDNLAFDNPSRKISQVSSQFICNNVFTKM